MSFPHTDCAVYRENPLVEVICQFRFPAILAVAAESPYKFQELVRGAYPVYEKIEGLPGIPREVAAILSQIPIGSSAESVTHCFRTEDRTRFISLAQEFVSVTTTAHDRWEALKQAMQLAEESVRQIYEPAFYSRVGLRYQDVIRREALGLQDEPWSSLITPQFAGLLAAGEIQS